MNFAVGHEVRLPDGRPIALTSFFEGGDGSIPHVVAEAREVCVPRAVPDFAAATARRSHRTDGKFLPMGLLDWRTRGASRRPPA